MLFCTVVIFLLFFNAEKNAGDFSQFQLQNLLHRSQLSGRLKSVREDMAKQSAGIATTDLAGQPGEDLFFHYCVIAFRYYSSN